MEQQILTTSSDDEYYQISLEGLNKLVASYDSKEPLRNVLWTTDYSVELPILLKKQGPGIILIYDNSHTHLRL